MCMQRVQTILQIPSLSCMCARSNFSIKTELSRFESRALCNTFPDRDPQGGKTDLPSCSQDVKTQISLSFSHVKLL